jgi:bifunctional DNA-binding transcriptional regulator/antitoxin component of YhaV-PrlF toxin-antitoxin module
MSASVVRAKRQITLPKDVCQAAGIRIGDQVDWRFEEGEIRGRKLVLVREKVRRVRPIKSKDLLIAPQNLEIDMKQLDEELRHNRAEKY